MGLKFIGGLLMSCVLISCLFGGPKKNEYGDPYMFSVREAKSGVLELETNFELELPHVQAVREVPGVSTVVVTRYKLFITLGGLFKSEKVMVGLLEVMEDFMLDVGEEEGLVGESRQPGPDVRN